MVIASQIMWLFFIYSFAGWILETILGTIKNKKYVNKGLVTGPFCVIYGFAAVLLSVFLQELKGIPLFLFCTVIATVVEWVAGHLIERFFKERWWDYHDLKWNLDGYIAVLPSLIWGAFGYVGVRWLNGFFMQIIGLLPSIVSQIIMLVASILLFIDILASSILLSGRSKQEEKWELANSGFEKASDALGGFISGKIRKRINKAYPKKVKVQKEEKHPEIFAYGCSFYKIVLLFIIGAFLGDITETIYCRITAGYWMSRSSVVWGPFSVVWGLGIAGATLLLYRYKDRKDVFLFWMGTFLGGVFEYLCSVFTEIFFGKVFWDYSWMPFNLGGRINLLYCFFWGFAAVIWFKRIYPLASKEIERLPKKFGTIATWGLLIFMICNVSVSAMALVRYDARSKDKPADNSVEEWLDEKYDDQRMERIYPNAKAV